jgi:uncharacterized membrane protein
MRPLGSGATRAPSRARAPPEAARSASTSAPRAPPRPRGRPPGSDARGHPRTRATCASARAALWSVDVIRSLLLFR